ncbi:MAG: 50S ribosomal protein L25/general stress protein Ctc [Rhodobacteraceae bacterium]|nr:50S ribosomal protein L25/general stress protein Ctc [Paracoccaceae bacterium]
MAEMPNINATLRTGTGKGAARQARREGLVPGVVYGDNAAPIAINVKFNELLKQLRAGRFLSTLFNLKVDGQEDVRVICRGVQRDVVKDLPTHIDLMRLHRNSRVNLFVPVEFINHETSEGLKKGGVLTVIRSEVELKVTADNIPNSLVVDLENLDVGDHVNISDIDLPEGTRPMIMDRDFVIANISAPSSLKSSDSEDEEEATAEGEAEGSTEE